MFELNKIHNVDARVLLGAMESGSVDLILTDPPYGLNKAEWDGSFPTHWIEDALRVGKRLLVMTGNSELIRAGAAFGDTYRDLIVLHSRNGMTRSKIAFGNFIPVLAFGTWDWKARPNYIPFNTETSEAIEHASPKPIEAMKRLLHYYAEPGWIIVDPFIGSGTTAIASELLGYQWVGSEIDETTCQRANERIERWRAQGVLDFDQTTIKKANCA